MNVDYAVLKKMIMSFTTHLYRSTLYLMFIAKSFKIVRFSTFSIITTWNRRTENARRKIDISGFELAAKDRLVDYKKSDTLVVLGSSPSILEITQEQWSRIKQFDSIGFNLFFVENFIPTFYHMEVEDDYYDFFKECYLDLNGRYHDIPFMINFNHLGSAQNSSSFDFINNLLVTAPENYHGATESELTEILEYFYCSKRYLKRQLLFHYRASALLMISFGALLGYRRIILAGIDLVNNDYFFERSPQSSALAQKVKIWKSRVKKENGTNSKARVHRTADPNVFPGIFPVDKAIYLYNDIALEKLGVELFVTNKRSLLYPRIPFIGL